MVGKIKTGGLRRNAIAAGAAVSAATLRKTVSKPSEKPREAVAVVVEKDQKFKQKIKRNMFGKSRSNFAALKYSSIFTCTVPVGQTADAIYSKVSAASGLEMIYRLNSIARPFYTQVAGNVLPQGVNSAQTNYSKYKVIACKWRVRGYDPEGEDLRICTFTTASSDAQVLSGTNMQQMDMKRGFRYAHVPVTGDQEGSVRGYTKIQGIEGLNKYQFNGNESAYVGVPTQVLATANTAEANMKNPLLHIGVSPTYTLAGDATVKIEIEIIYYTYFYNQNTIPMSYSS